ncbi:MAG: MMPL family transporter [Planctomycetota bacterium]|nr:MMPL family transporter [Planctomycetota bacterium]
MDALQYWLLRVVLAVATYPRRTLLIVLGVLLACIGVSAARLTISSDQNKLFSAKVPFFHNYLEFIHRFRENEAVYIVIEPRNPNDKPAVTQWAAVADLVTETLRKLPDVTGAQCRVPLDQLGRQGVLFENPANLPREFQGAKDLSQLAALWGQNLPGMPLSRFMFAVRLHADDQSAGLVAAMGNSLANAVRNPNVPLRVGEGVVDISVLDATDPSQLGYFYEPDETNHAHHRILIRVYPQRIFNSLTAVSRTVNSIRNTAVSAAKQFPEFKVGVTGRPALEADEMQATDRDSHRAEIWALAAVFVGMVFMLRSIWLAVVAEIALGVGIGWTFGWTTLTVGQLNLLSLVFLIALIGIGMDYLVQILTRYRMEARRYERPGAVWVRVFKHVGPPITTACLGAAGAFFVAVFTDFQGAAELGIIAGGGLVLCLISGYVVLPALLTLFPLKLKPLDAAQRYVAGRQFGSAARLALPALWIFVLALFSPYMAKTYFNPGLIDLQVPNLESVQLIRSLQTWSAVVTSRDLNQLRQIRDKVAGLSTVKTTDSLLNTQDNAQWLIQHNSELPSIAWAQPNHVSADDLAALGASAQALAGAFGDPADSLKQRASTGMANLAAVLNALSTGPLEERQKAAVRLSAWQNIFAAELKDLLDAFHARPLDLAAVPEELKSHYASNDGYYALYIYPRADLWIRANLIAFENQVEAAVGQVPGAPPVTGIASNVYHTTDSIHQAFYHSTIYALVLIFILVLLDFRRIVPTLAAISVLALGLPMLVAIMGFLGASWNFANFFGLPILIGAGHEYGVFMVHRYLEARNDPRRVWKSWDVSDRALLLCAFITSTSFGFFWLLARHQGLKSLGLVMALGTACIYFATICVLRPLLKWKLARFNSRQ